MPFKKINHIEMYYEQKGHGEPLILIGGLTNNHQIWSFMLDDLVNEFCVILPDNRGAGKTSQPEEGYTIVQMADDIAQLMEAIGIESAYIAGLSMGGAIVQQLCLNYHKKVKAAVIAASAGKFSPISCLQLRSTIELAQAGVAQEIIFNNVVPWIYATHFIENGNNILNEKHRVMNEPFPQSLAGYIGQIHAIEKFDVRNRLPEIQCPVLVIAGSDDLLTPIQDAKNLINTIPNAKLLIIEECGHMIHREKPHEFAKGIVNFIK